MNRFVLGIIATFLLLNFSTGKSGEVKNEPPSRSAILNIKEKNDIRSDTLRKVRTEISDVTTLCKEITTQDVKVFYKRHALDDFIFVVIRHPINIDSLSTAYYRLSIHRLKNNNLIETYIYDSGIAGPFVALTPIVNTGNRVLVTFSRGSGEHYVVFALINGQIAIALNEATQGALEQADIDNDGDMEILLTDKGPVADAITKEIIINPKETGVFKWNGKSYELLRTVPWKNRFQELPKR